MIIETFFYGKMRANDETISILSGLVLANLKCASIFNKAICDPKYTQKQYLSPNALLFQILHFVDFIASISVATCM